MHVKVDYTTLTLLLQESPNTNTNTNKSSIPNAPIP